MKFPLLNQKGFAPVILLVILAALGVTGVGTAVAANNSVAGDPLFGLDRAIEELQVNLATGDEAKVKIRLEIAQERLQELQAIANTNRAVDPAVTEAQLAVNNATNSLSNVETKFKENKITLKSSDLQALLIELQNLLTTHQGLIKKIEIKIKDGEVRAKIKLFKQESSRSAGLVDRHLKDLEDDGELNDSDEDEEENDDDKPKSATSSARGKHERGDRDGDNDDDDKSSPNSSSGTSGRDSHSRSGSSDRDDSVNKDDD